MKNEELGFASWTKRNGWVGALKGINNDQMYLVHSSEQQTLHISGSAVDPTTHQLTIRGAKSDGTPRWNYISYLPSDNFTLKEALAGYDAKEGDIVKSQTQMAMYSGNLGWIGSLTYMENGKGYMMQRQSQDDAILQYPSKTSVGRKSKAARANAAMASEPAGFFPYSANMTAVVEVEGVELQQGDKLVGYVAGERRGTAEAITLPDGRNIFMMTMGGDKQEAVDMAIERGGETIAKATSAIGYVANSNVGTINEPMLISFIGNAGGLYIYPSPFHSQLKIRASVDRNASVDVFVNDMSGQRVASWDDCNDNGTVDITWNAGNIHREHLRGRQRLLDESYQEVIIILSFQSRTSWRRAVGPHRRKPASHAVMQCRRMVKTEKHEIYKVFTHCRIVPPHGTMHRRGRQNLSAASRAAMERGGRRLRQRSPHMAGGRCNPCLGPALEGRFQRHLPNSAMDRPRQERLSHEHDRRGAPLAGTRNPCRRRRHDGSLHRRRVQGRGTEGDERRSAPLLHPYQGSVERERKRGVPLLQRCRKQGLHLTGRRTEV